MRKHLQLEDRLRLKFKEDHPDKCWLWSGAKNGSGYGMIVVSGKLRTRAHRAVYELLVGPIPEGKICCHKCDTPSCVNPNHIFIGTHKDNSADMCRKGRQGVNTMPRPMNRGSGNGNCWMTEDQVESLRLDRKNGMKLRDIVQKYGCSVSSASRLSNFKTHKQAMELNNK